MKARKIVNIIIPVVLVCMILFSGYKLIMSVRDSGRTAEANERIQELVVVKPAETGQETQQAQTVQEEVQTVRYGYPNLQIDVDALKEINGDFCAWLYFPALELSYPIVQGEDNDYYLKHSFEGEKLNSGSIFLDYEAAPDWSDRNTFVYGHSMRDGSMFGTFKKLLDDPSLCQVNTNFYIYTEDTVYTYEIFAIFKTNKNSGVYIVFEDDESYDNYVDWVMARSVYRSDVDLSSRSNIVSLSTCYGGAGTSRRMLVQGVRTAEEPYVGKPEK